MKVRVIGGGGYTKFLFFGLGLPDDQEFSIILAKEEGGESLPHDHNVDEETYVVRGSVIETREAEDGSPITNHYGQGMQFHVPAGTRHRVVFKASTPSTVTVNWCQGHLSMNALVDFLKRTKAA